MRLLRSTAIVSSMTFLSRITGFVRDVVFARVFGVSPAMDAFLVAFRIPNFLRRLFAEGSFSLAFVPVLAEYREKHDALALKGLVDRVTGSLAGVLLAITGLGMLASPWVIAVFAPGFAYGEYQHRLASELLRITFPYLFFISLTALAGGILNSFQRFALPAVTPVLLNLSMIAAALGLAPSMDEPVEALAWGVLVAGVLQLAVQVPALARMGLLPRPRWGGSHPGVRKILTLMLPTLFGSSVAQVNLLFDTLVASLLLSGSVTWLYYSDRLLEFPLGMFGVAIGTVILPHLSRQHAVTDPDGFSRGLDWGLRTCLLIGVPASLGLGLAAEPLFAALFQYGAFSAADARMAALSLTALAVGLPAFLLVKVLAPAFYARQDTRTPVRAAVVSMLVNVMLTVVFLAGLLWLTPLGAQARAEGGSVMDSLARMPGAHASLALASALAGWVNAGQLWLRLRREGVFRAQPGWRGFGSRLALSGTVMAAVVLALLAVWPEWGVWTVWERIARLAALVGGAALVFFGVLFGSGFRRRHLG